MKYNHMFDVAFNFESNNDEENVTIDELIKAMEKRLLDLKSEKCIEAFGHCDTYEVEIL
tara:strand:+ start:66 stop:242 length:177 start_codon:yes stop_codon:yes gene_type:complete